MGKRIEVVNETMTYTLNLSMISILPISKLGLGPDRPPVLSEIEQLGESKC